MTRFRRDSRQHPYWHDAMNDQDDPYNLLPELPAPAEFEVLDG